MVPSQIRFRCATMGTPFYYLFIYLFILIGSFLKPHVLGHSSCFYFFKLLKIFTNILMAGLYIFSIFNIEYSIYLLVTILFRTQ